MRKKERERLSDGLRLKGWGKFFHGLFLFITFPIRKPLIFVPILMFAYLAPTFMGARPSEVHLWYWNKIKMHTQNMGNSISQKTQEMMPNVDSFKISMPTLKSIGTNSKEDKTEELAEAPTPSTQEIRRQIFEKSKEIPNTVDALRTAQLQEERMRLRRKTSSPRENMRAFKEETPKKLPLVFVNNKEQINDTAEVINANELKINGKTYFLHGIYVDPKSPKGLEAKNFLKSVIAQNIIQCQVKAYTYQGVGTLICSVNGENINWLLVNRGYSKNVALDK